MVCEVAGIGGEGEEAGGERVRLKGGGLKGYQGSEIRMRVCVEFEASRSLASLRMTTQFFGALSRVVGLADRLGRRSLQPRGKRPRKGAVAKRRRPLQKAAATRTGANTARCVEQKDGKTHGG